MARRRTRLAVESGRESGLDQSQIKSRPNLNKYATFFRAAKEVARLAPPELTTWVREDHQDQLLSSACEGGLQKIQALPIGDDGKHAEASEGVRGNTLESRQPPGNAGSDAEGATASVSGGYGVKADQQDEKEDLADSSRTLASSENSQGGDMDMVVDNFMDELKVTGLLDEKEELRPATEIPDHAEAAQSCLEKKTELDAKSMSANPPETSASEEIVSQGVSDATPSTTAAEQRVMGYVEGATGWQIVKDMESGRIYYWHVDTNEVAWQPPVTPLPDREEGEPPSASGMETGDGKAEESGELDQKASAGSSRIVEESSGASAQAQASDKPIGQQLLETLNVAQEERGELEAELSRLGSWEAYGEVAALISCLAEIDLRATDIQSLQQGQLWQHEAVLTYFLERMNDLVQKIQTLKSSVSKLQSSAFMKEENVAVSSADHSAPPLPPEAPEDGELLVEASMEPAWGIQLEEDAPLPQSLEGDEGGSGTTLQNGAPLDSMPPLPPEESDVTEVLENSLTMDDPNSLHQGSMPAAPAAVAVTANQPEEPSSRSKRKGDFKGLPTTKRKTSSTKIGKEASKLINKWISVKEDMRQEAVTKEQQEDRRNKAAEEWILTTKETAEDNPNLQPITQNWRLKVLAAKQAALEEPAGKDVHGMPNLEELSRSLPANWQALWDATSQRVYYANFATQETTWEQPV